MQPVDRPHPRPRRTLIAILCASAMLGSSACGGPTPARGEAFFKIVEQSSAALPATVGLAPSQLTDALPNRIHTFTGAPESVRVRLSAAVVVGQVESVAKGEARRHTGEDGYEVVDFDDPRADERALTVSVRGDEAWTASGEGGLPEIVTFRLGLMGQADVEGYLAMVAELDRVAVFLAKVEDGPDAGEFYPADGARLIGVVTDEDTISFPAYGDEVNVFLNGVDTLQELRVEAGKTEQTINHDSARTSLP